MQKLPMGNQTNDGKLINTNYNQIGRSRKKNTDILLFNEILFG